MIDIILIAFIIFSVLTSAFFWKIIGVGAFAVLFIISPIIRVYSIMLMFIFVLSIFYNNA